MLAKPNRNRDEEMRFLKRQRAVEPERAKENWHVTGRGGQRGRDWTERRQWGGREQRGDHDWFGGFLSGMSLERNEHLLRDHSFEEAVAWLDKRCEAFPDDQICYSAAKVAAKLIWPETDPMSE